MSFKIDYFTTSFFCPFIQKCCREIQGFSITEHCVKCKKYKQFRKEIYDIVDNGTKLPIARLVKIFNNGKLVTQYIRIINPRYSQILQQLAKQLNYNIVNPYIKQ